MRALPSARVQPSAPWPQLRNRFAYGVAPSSGVPFGVAGRSRQCQTVAFERIDWQPYPERPHQKRTLCPERQDAAIDAEVAVIGADVGDASAVGVQRVDRRAKAKPHAHVAQVCLQADAEAVAIPHFLAWRMDAPDETLRERRCRVAQRGFQRH